MSGDEKIQKRLEELLSMGAKVLATRRSPPPNVFSDDYIDTQLGHQWATSVQSLLGRVFGVESAHYKNFSKQTQGHLGFSPIFRGQGILNAARDDYVNGYLFDLRRLVEGEIFDDFLEQAEHLLSSGYYQAAAVVAGCVMEDGLRKLCAKRGIAVASKPKLDVMNADLAKAGVYSKLVQKRVTALADLRNKAAHGEWASFVKEDVVEMLPAVRRFMEDYIA
jgi:hypothetical protein